MSSCPSLLSTVLSVSLFAGGGGGGSAFGFGFVKIGFTMFSNVCNENQHKVCLPDVHAVTLPVCEILPTFWRMCCSIFRIEIKCSEDKDTMFLIRPYSGSLLGVSRIETCFRITYQYHLQE